MPPVNNLGTFEVRSRYVDIEACAIYPAVVRIQDGLIATIERLPAEADVSGFMLPGFIDSHVHIESSMLVPSEFARLAVVHGTIGTVSDPHEIANVCGLEGVDFMIRNGNTVPFYFNFGAPSCVPATVFETAGDKLDSDDVRGLLERPEIRYLSEMMNFPGVLNGDEEVMRKISAAHELGKPVDGHAPGLRGEAAAAYIHAGISTDHECFTSEEAREKLELGMKILIREGSAARNFDALIQLLHDYSDRMMFCSDDKHPDSLEAGHINQLCARAVRAGVDVFKVLKAACINPVIHYRLPSGLLRKGDPADFIIVTDLDSFSVAETYIRGQQVAAQGRSLMEPPAMDEALPNRFAIDVISAPELRVVHPGGMIPVIEALDGQLITNRLECQLDAIEGEIQSDPSQDILKIVVVNRYQKSPPAIAFIRNVGLKEGAIASSVAHDSHNIVATGTDDHLISKAINNVIACKGGISCVSPHEEQVISLPVAGLMSTRNGYEVAHQYTRIDRMAKDLGSTLGSPFMTLSFMALLVIPHLKLSDRGLFDGDSFSLIG